MNITNAFQFKHIFKIKIYKRKHDGSVIIYTSVLMYCIILCFIYIIFLQCNEYKVLCHEKNYARKQLQICNTEQILFNNLYIAVNEKKLKLISDSPYEGINIGILLKGCNEKISLGNNEYMKLIVNGEVVEIKYIKDGMEYTIACYSIIIGESKLLITPINNI